MSSRQQEKEARRREREEFERAEAVAAARKKRLGIVAGVVLGVAAVAAVAVVLASGGGGGNGAKTQGDDAAKVPDVKPPARQISGLAPAAKAADCTVRSFKSEGQQHIETKGTYKTNPPSSGDHNPNPAQDGIYPPGQAPAPENFVHSLEHGRIEIQYKPGTSRRVIGQLQALAAERDGYHVLVFENPTKMPYDVAATAWTNMLACPKANDKMFDAIRAFRARYEDQAPEFVP